MFTNCIGLAIRIPDAVKDLEALQLWLKDGSIVRWAVLYPRQKTVRVFSTPLEAAAQAAPGVYIVRLERTERNTEELLGWIKEAVAKGEAIHV